MNLYTAPPADGTAHNASPALLEIAGTHQKAKVQPTTSRTCRGSTRRGPEGERIADALNFILLSPILLETLVTRSTVHHLN